MSSATRISVIGAGSAIFSLGLVRDLCLTDSLSGSEICFMDVDPVRLETVHNLATRYAAELGSNLTFETTTNRQTALQGAEFVINTAYVQGHQRERELREATTRHGYFYGGVSLGDFHQFRLMLAVANDMERICPDAWLIQSANPVFEGSTLMMRETNVKVCGLCHGHHGVWDICRTLGIDPAEVTWQAPGLNHNIWLTEFRYRGDDAYPLLDKWAEEKGVEYWSDHLATGTHDIQMSRAAFHQYHMFGRFPIGDTVRWSGWWYSTDIDTKMRWFGNPWGGPDTNLARPIYVQNLEERTARMKALADDNSASLVSEFGEERTIEQQIPIIDALVNDNAGHFQVNVPNNGAMAGVPDDVAVEIPAVIDRSGISPKPFSSLPRKVMLERILPNWLEMERSLHAFKTGDLSVLLWGALESHQTNSYGQAVGALEALLGMEQSSELADHYLPPSGLELSEDRQV